MPLNIKLETTTGLLVPGGYALPIARGPQAATLQFLTASVAAFLANNAPIALKLYALDDTAAPLAIFDAWTKNNSGVCYTATLNPLAEAALGYLPAGTLYGRLSYGAVNVDTPLFHVAWGGSGEVIGAPVAPIVIREVGAGGGGGGVGALVQLVGTFGGRVAADQVEGYLAVLAAAQIPSVILTAQDAPTGSALLIELIKNGVATGKVATLAAGAKNQETAFGSPLAVAEGDVLQFKPTQVGSTKPGTNLVVQATMRGV